jgi:hypothetical protein
MFALLSGIVTMADVPHYLEPGPDGKLIGRHPLAMGIDGLKAAGHRPMSPSKALRLKCLDCCVGSPAEVRACTAIKCPSWPFRMGRNPYNKNTKVLEKPD